MEDPRALASDQPYMGEPGPRAKTATAPAEGTGGRGGPQTPTTPPVAAPTTPTAGAGTSAEPSAAGRTWPAAGSERSTRGAAAGGFRVSAPMWGGVSLVHITMAVLCLLTPRMVARILYSKSAAYPLEAQHDQLLQLNGGAVLVAAAAAAALGLAARGEWGRLSPAGKDLLRVGLAVQGLTNFILFGISYAGTVRTTMLPVELTVSSTLLALPAADLLASGRGWMQGAEIKRWLTPRPGSLLGGAHLLLALLFPLTGLALFVAPHYSLYHVFGYSYGSSTYLLAKLAGMADVAVIPLTQLVLKDAADKGALASQPARALNAGMLLAVVVHMAVLVPILAGGQPGGWMLPLANSTWLMALLTSGASMMAGMGMMGRRIGTGAGTVGGAGVGKTGVAEKAAPSQQEGEVVGAKEE